jgi:hypothetical protein
VENRDPEHWRRVEALCHAALEREPADRPAFLATECAGDEALQHEVEALLAHEPAAEGFLAAPVGALAANVMDGDSGASLAGRQLGPYQILSRVGAGGVGVIYRARDTVLGRDVAIKVLPTAFVTDQERLARFSGRRGCWRRSIIPTLRPSTGSSASTAASTRSRRSVQARIG